MVIGFDQLYVYARENTIYNIPTKGTLELLESGEFSGRGIVDA